MALLQVGDAVPEVSSFKADRTEIPLTGFKGEKNVVVAFYPRAFTGGCEQEMRKFETMIDDFRELDAEVVGSSTDAAPSQRAFAEHCSLTFPLVADFPAYTAARAFGVFNEERVTNARVTFVIDKQGIIQHVIEESRDMDRHAVEPLAVLRGEG